MAGLQDIYAMFCRLIVTKGFEPRLAAAAAASESSTNYNYIIFLKHLVI
jgi:hypothetical protein